MRRLIFTALLSLGGIAVGEAQTGPSADAILAKLRTCEQISAGRLALDMGKKPTVPICRRGVAVHWTADLDVDCDGARTARCNKQTDPDYRPGTALPGPPLDAAAVPYIVIPGPSTAWDFRKANIQVGACGAAIWNGRVVYAVVGDTGPAGIVGEGSYALAQALGINPDPRRGGLAQPAVTYVVFPGTRVRPADSPAAARACGERYAKMLVRGT